MSRATKPTPALWGTYAPPSLRKGDRAWCLVRGRELVVTGWTDAPVPWPRGCPPKKHPGFPSLVVTDELARAVREESAQAVMHFWGVSTATIIKWRKALGATRTNNEGSHQLIREATSRARAAQPPERSPEYRDKQREHTIRRRLWELAPRVTHGVAWTAEHLALLGTMSDREVALRTGHPYSSVKTERLRRRIPCFRGSKRQG